MITESQICWITRLDGLQEAIEVVGVGGVIILGIAIFSSAFVGVTEREEDAVAFSKKLVPFWLLFVLIVIFSLFIPKGKNKIIDKSNQGSEHARESVGPADSDK